MLLFAGIELGRVALQVRRKKDILVMLVIVIMSVLTNIAVGFIVDLLLYVFLERILRREQATPQETDESCD